MFRRTVSGHGSLVSKQLAFLAAVSVDFGGCNGSTMVSEVVIGASERVIGKRLNTGSFPAHILLPGR
jgi:hypothetical protein